MAKFRKKPVVIEAVHFFGFNSPNGVALEIPADVKAFIGRPIIQYNSAGIVISTMEGDHLASPGDWIIRGVKGELYPCKPDIFAMTYDPAE